MDRGLAIVGGGFGVIALIGLVSLFAAYRIGKKLDRLRREQHKTA